MKLGEEEALHILKSKGIEFDNKYYDDNSHNSMPDFQYKNGRYLEVTHTRHNNRLVTKYAEKSTDEKIKIEKRVREAHQRIISCDYEREEEFSWAMTENGKKQYKADKKFILRHYGDGSGFDCDVPIIQNTADNVLSEIVDDKGKKYPNGDTDLFIFVTGKEMDLVEECFASVRCNRYSQVFVTSIVKSPFPVIYLCEWDLIHNKYNTENPKLMRIEKKQTDGITICYI